MTYYYGKCPDDYDVPQPTADIAWAENVEKALDDGWKLVMLANGGKDSFAMMSALTKVIPEYADMAWIFSHHNTMMMSAARQTDSLYVGRWLRKIESQAHYEMALENALNIYHPQGKIILATGHRRAEGFRGTVSAMRSRRKKQPIIHWRPILYWSDKNAWNEMGYNIKHEWDDMYARMSLEELQDRFDQYMRLGMYSDLFEESDRILPHPAYMMGHYRLSEYIEGNQK